jgi:hypothetical protein
VLGSGVPAVEKSLQADRSSSTVAGKKKEEGKNNKHPCPTTSNAIKM